jgi:hypothetical protein
MKRTRPRGLLIASALLVASLAAAPASEAASSKHCKTLAANAKAKVVVKSSKAMVVVKGKSGQLTQTYYACLYAKPGLYKLPGGQNGGDTEFFGKFTLAGRYLAYQHVNEEPAASDYPAWIDLVDLKQRKRIYERDAVKLSKEEESFGATTSVLQILLRSDGAVAWIGRHNNKDFTVNTVLLKQKTASEVDRGKNIGGHSLKAVANDPNTFSWLRGGTRKTAPFGGPAPTP